MESVAIEEGEDQEQQFETYLMAESTLEPSDYDNSQTSQMKNHS